jgi:hypothetical protein
MTPFRFGIQSPRFRRQRARCPHHLRPADREVRMRPRAEVYNRLDQCPEDIRDCISEIRQTAKIEKEEVSYIARQFYFVVKRRLVDLGKYIVEFALTVLLIRAKNGRIQFRFLRGSQKCLVNLEAEEALAA